MLTDIYVKCSHRRGICQSSPLKTNISCDHDYRTKVSDLETKVRGF